MKLCVFQGTFNPIHNAHLSMANYIKNVYDYDLVLFIPAYKPPHKELDDEMSNHRFQMVKLAISGEGYFNISNIEFQNERFSYTYLTIEELYKRYKIEGKIGFIIGADAFSEIADWYEADKLKELVHFLVFPRLTDINLSERLTYLQKRGYNFNVVKMPPVNISSTSLRQKLINSQPVSTSVPQVVLEYINQHGLYKE